MKGRTEVKQRKRRRSFVAMLTLQGMSIEAIHDALVKAGEPHCSTRTIRHDLEHLESQWQKQSMKSIDTQKWRKFESLNLVARKAWDSFTRSQQDEVVVSEKHYVAKDGSPLVERTERKRGQAGDPRFLAIILDVHREQSELLGLKEVAPLFNLNVEGAQLPSIVARFIEEQSELAAGGLVIDGQYVESYVDKHGGNGQPKLAKDNGEDE
jgi:hypothetical protein